MPMTLALLSTPVSAAASPLSSAPRECRLAPTFARDGGESMGVSRLDQQPPGELLLGMLRLHGGCADPIVIRHDVGMPPKRQTPRPGLHTSSTNRP